MPIVGNDELRSLLKACEGKGFDEQRDAAILRLFLDTRCRRAEVAGLTVDEVDLTQSVVIVLGKARATGPCRSALGPPRRSTATCA